MKILPLALACTGLLAFTVACDNASNVEDCSVDADCLDAATPVCIDSFCQADDSECEEAVDCQIAYNASDDGDSATCEGDVDCDADADEICASGFEDQGFCVSSDDGSGACEDVGGVGVTVTKAEGGDAEACLDAVADRSCAEGTCSVE